MRAVDRHACSKTAFTALAEDDVEHTLIGRFAEQVAGHADCLAVRDPDRSLTYGELDGWANGIARAILERGGGGAPVVILLPQGAANVATILGVLKAGSPYVSLDPSDPRSPELAKRVGARVVVSSTEHGRGTTVTPDEVAPAADPGIVGSPDDTAYVFFTSGSTGRPKGVFDSHRNVLHNVLRYTNTLRIAPFDRLSLIQSAAFSGTVSTIFAGLLNGASVFPLSLADHGLAVLGRWLRDEEISVYHSVPAIFRALLRVDPGPYEHLRVVRLEGDRASWADVELHRRHCRGSVLVNGLGLTETGLVRQLFVHADAEPTPGGLPVGHAVPGVDVILLDDAGARLPAGAIGEIGVQSAHLALGYWDEPKLTQARFVRVDGRRTYLTGDLGRLRADGCLEYLGRRDGNLKIRGNRVEPAEVEAELLRLEGVEEALVVVEAGRRGEGQLTAYVAGSGEPDGVRRSLEERLPAYMIPSHVRRLEEVPVSASGKPDRSRLATPATDLERIIARIWEEVLATGPIGVHDDFFALGGDSLASAEIVARLARETGDRVPLSAIAGAPTVRELAEVIGSSALVPPSSLVVLRAGRTAPLILLHNSVGHALHFGEVASAVEPGRPVWALEHGEPVAASIREMAARHAATLLDARPEGPFHLAGLCYGAVVAHELACQLVTAGHQVQLMALLGITPLEFPTIVSREASAAWRTTRGAVPVAPRVRRHAGHARRLPLGAGVRYLTSVARREGRTRKAFARALAGHRPNVYPGRVLVVLHGDETPEYTTDPEREWAGLADEVEVLTVPGREHAMIEQPGVYRLVEILGLG